MARFPAHLRHAVAKANSRMGLHVRVDAADFTIDNIKNLVRTFYAFGDMICLFRFGKFKSRNGAETAVL